jgi:large subunit ribosomal protein L25
MSALGLNESVHLKDIKLPEGVAITSLTHGGDNLAVAAISMIKVVEEAPVVAAPAEGEAAAAAPAEGEAKAGEAKAGEAKKGEVPKAEAKKPEAKKEGK